MGKEMELKEACGGIGRVVEMVILIRKTHVFRQIYKS